METTKPNDPSTGFFSKECGTAYGLTKREYFALHLAASYAGANNVGNSGTAHEDIAHWGARMADALIAELNKPIPQS